MKQITYEIYSSSRSCRLETEEKEGECTHILPKSNKLTVAIVSYSFQHQNNLDNHKKVAWRLELIPTSYSENISPKQCSLILVLVVCWSIISVTWEHGVSDPPGEEDEWALGYDELPGADVPHRHHPTPLPRQTLLPIHHKILRSSLWSCYAGGGYLVKIVWERSMYTHFTLLWLSTLCNAPVLCTKWPWCKHEWWRKLLSFSYPLGFYSFFTCFLYICLVLRWW